MIYRSLLVLLITALPFTLAAKERPIRVGASPVASTVGIFLAQDLGHFRQEGVEIKLQIFSASASPMMPLLARGELDVGGGNITAGLFNAKAQDVSLYLVADKGQVRRDAQYSKILVREALWKKNYRGAKDLQGLRVGLPAITGTTGEAALDRYLKTAQLSVRDVKLVKLASYADCNRALAQGDIDATVQIEPYLTAALDEKIARVAASVYDLHPDQQSAALFFSPGFATTERPRALAFLRAYLRGIRYYNEALRRGRQSEEWRQVVKTLATWTSTKDEQILQRIEAIGLHPDGALNLASIQSDAEFFLRAGHVSELGDLRSLIKTDLVEEAARQLAAREKK